jgi:hypothetical protein
MTPKHCTRCGSLGILEACVNGQDLATLVYCDCEWSQPGYWRLPRITSRIDTAFTLSRVPLGVFLPDTERGSRPRGSFIASMGTRIEDWKRCVRSAESFWREHANTFGVQVSGDNGGAA